jgi:hypothetical protein
VPLSFKAKNRKVKFFTSNQSSYTQSNNIIRIPISSATGFLDAPNSFIKLVYQNLQGAGGKTHTFCNSASSLFKRIRVISSKGGELEDIVNYNITHSVVSDLMLSFENRASRGEAPHLIHKQSLLVLLLLRLLVLLLLVVDLLRLKHLLNVINSEPLLLLVNQLVHGVVIILDALN